MGIDFFDANWDKPFSVTITGCKPKTLYARAIKGTFTNEVMKKNLLSFLIVNFDLRNGMIMAFKLHLSENQVLHVGVFPDKQTADKAGEAAKPVVPTQDNGQRAKVQAHRSVVHGPWATGRGFWISGWLDYVRFKELNTTSIN
jgi:hypothetical protein